ncbi:uncharacterized protein LOC126778337 [Nymphalis io]|uniref:uncharacterized protein LOC126778337 n=1 Tax=Inachis io TaxID=171585 RepID=UPI0021686C8B|nr:uncharacterized protein LOC126778337 [Nymphalis io]
MNCANNTEAFSQYLQSMVKLEELQKMTEDLDKELEDSQRVMSEIKTIFNTIPNVQNNIPQQNNDLRHEDLSQFIVASVPKLIMPDMPDSTVDIDLDNVIASMKGYAEDLRKNFVLPNPQQEHPNKIFENLDLDQYASSLEELSKQLLNMKLNKNGEGIKRNKALEAKLDQLCEDVTMFTKMVQSKAKLSESNKNWTTTHHTNLTLQYDNMINKLLLCINEVTYLMKNKN